MSIEHTREVMQIYWDGREAEVIAENAVYTMMASGEEAQGREAVLQTMRDFYRKQFEGHFEMGRSFIADGHAVLEGFVVGKHKGAFAGIAPSGKDVRIPMCIVYDVSDGFVQAARIYMDTAVLLQ